MSDNVSQKAKGNGITQIAGDVNININIDIDAEIDEAANFIKDGKAVEAINLLEKLWRRYNDSMTARRKYRTQANIGHAYDQLGKYDDAAVHWLRAAQCDPDYEEAQARRALAFFYQGNVSESRRIAEAVLAEYSENTLARAVWIRTSPENTTLDHLEEKIPIHVKDDPDVLMALAAVAADKREWGQAEGYLTQALQKAEGHPRIKEQLGRLLLQKAELWKYTVIEKQPTSDEKSRINKAIEYLTAASTEWKKQNKVKQLVQTILSLVAAYRAIGENKEAENNIRLAYDLDNSNKMAACEYAALLGNQGETDRAIGILAPLTDAPENLVTADLYAQLLINRNRNNDKENALTILKDNVSALDNAIPAFRFDYIKQVILLRHSNKT